MGGKFSHNAVRTRREQQEQRSKRFSSFLKSIRNWHLLLVMVPLLFIAATLLRLDHIRMTELKNAVFAADEAGDDAAISKSLLELKEFVGSHTVVNFIEKNGVSNLVFGTGPFYLEHSYNRKAAVALAEAEKKAAEMSDANPNGNVFAKAMAVCQPRAQANGWTWNSPAYINCYTNVINSFPAQDTLDTTVTADIPPTALFRHDFTSPVWYPTAAGWVILLCALLLVIVIVRAIYWIILQIALRIVK